MNSNIVQKTSHLKWKNHARGNKKLAMDDTKRSGYIKLTQQEGLVKFSKVQIHYFSTIITECVRRSITTVAPAIDGCFLWIDERMTINDVLGNLDLINWLILS